MFGTEGTGFMRMNLGTPQHVLQTALKRLADAVETNSCHVERFAWSSERYAALGGFWANGCKGDMGVAPQGHVGMNFVGDDNDTVFVGMVSSYTIIPSAKLREPFFHWLDVNELASPDIFAPIATIAAFTHGAEWRQTMLREIEKNILFTEAMNSSHRSLSVDASYLRMSMLIRRYMVSTASASRFEEDLYALFSQCGVSLETRAVSSVIDSSHRLRFFDIRRSGIRKATKAGVTISENTSKF